MSRPKPEQVSSDAGAPIAVAGAGSERRDAVVTARATSTLSQRGGEPGRGAGRSIWAGRAALVLVAVPAVVLLVPLVAHRGPFSNWGDAAAAELAVQNAAHLHQTVGPYDRFGWNHPGPAAFYVLAIPYTLMGGRGVALSVGAALVNLGAGLGIVALIGRRAGAKAAVGSAGLVVLFESFLGVANLTNVWNPVLIVLPTALFLVVCADLAVGGAWTLVAAVALGSFLVQTHIGTLAAVAVALGLAVALRSVRWARSATRPRAWKRPLAIAGTAVAVGALLWAPPVWQQLTGQPGNLTRITRFFLHGHGHHPVGDAFAALANGMVAIHLGRHLGTDVGASHRHDPALAALLLTVMAVAGLCWYRRQWFGLALAAGVLPVAGVFLLSLLRVQDDIVGYLVLWTGSLTLCAALALLVCLTGAPPARSVRPAWPDGVRMLGGGVLAAGALAASVHLSAQGLRVHPGGGYQKVTDASAAVERLLPPGNHRVLVCITSADAWPSAGGVVANLRRDGWDARVGVHWLYILGRQLAPTGREDAAVFLETSTNTLPPLPVSPVSTGEGGDLTVRVYQPVQAPVPASLCPYVP